MYRVAKTWINRIRNPWWEARVIAHRNHIRARARARQISYAPAAIRAQIRARVSRKRLQPPAARVLRIFSVYCSRGWTGDNLPAVLKNFGTVRHFELDAFADGDPYSWFRQQRTAQNKVLLDDLRAWHSEAPVDVFFYYGGGLELQRATLRAINALGIATFSMGLDDLSGLSKGKIDGEEIALAELAPDFDLCYTSTLAACEEYLLLGARPYYLPMGANPQIYRRLDLPRDIPIAFFGQKHGVRAALVRALAAKGIAVQTFGAGWSSGSVPIDRLVELINRSQIVLGHGHHSPYAESLDARLTCLKARDFEIPMCGAVYLTTFDPELAFWFAIGAEVMCYRTADDLYDTIHYLLNHPQKLESIREATWRRAHREHTWEQRFAELFSVLGVLA